MNYYTYAYLRVDKTPYYIGKGKGSRIHSKNRIYKPPKDKSRIIFLKQNLTEEESFKHEEYMIKVFGRKDNGTGILRNKTDGGDGASGLIVTEEHRKKISASLTPEQRREWGIKAQASRTPEQRRESVIKGHASLTPEQRSERSRKGYLSSSLDERIERAKKGANQKFQCTVTGFISNAGGLSTYQKAKGIDKSNRVRLF
jgi:hypothetical protein